MIFLNYSVNLYSINKNDINNFLKFFYDEDLHLENKLKHSLYFEAPNQMIDLISALIENNEKYKINTWISLDKGIFINVTQYNLDSLIRYIYERFPY